MSSCFRSEPLRAKLPSAQLWLFSACVVRVPGLVYVFKSLILTRSVLCNSGQIPVGLEFKRRDVFFVVHHGYANRRQSRAG